MDNITYNEVPKIITGKDLDYLSDMFNWNYEGKKKLIPQLLILKIKKYQLFCKKDIIYSKII